MDTGRLTSFAVSPVTVEMAQISVFLSREERKASRSFDIQAVWEATSTGETAVGTLTVPGQGGHNTAEFTLNVVNFGELTTPEACLTGDPDCCKVIREIQREDVNELSVVCGSRG